MRVMLFFDGRNFFNGLKRTHGPAERIDYNKLTRSVVETVVPANDHGIFMGAHYYVGVSDDTFASTIQFLDGLANCPGFFVQKHKQTRRDVRCPRCKEQYAYATEKGVDVQIAVDMLLKYHAKAYDAAVLFSGDEDFVPAVLALRSLGAQVWVATWGTELAANLRQAAFGHINLNIGLPTFRQGGSYGATS